MSKHFESVMHLDGLVFEYECEELADGVPAIPDWVEVDGVKFIPKRTCKRKECDQDYWRCTNCGAFNYWDAVTDLCGVIPSRYCACCGAKVAE